MLEACHEERVRIDTFRLAQLAYLGPPMVDNTAGIYEREGNTRARPLASSRPRQKLFSSATRSGLRKRLPAYEGFFVVALGTEALDD